MRERDPFGPTVFIIRILEHYNQLWEKLTMGVDTNLIGHILFNHLIVEHYLTEYLTVLLPEHFDVDKADLNFAKKIMLIGLDPFLTSGGMKEGVLALNTIRNSFAHNLQKPIDVKYLEVLVKVIKASTNEPAEPLPTIADKPEKIIKIFTSIFVGKFLLQMVDLAKNPEYAIRIGRRLPAHEWWKE